MSVLSDKFIWRTLNTSVTALLLILG